MLTKERLMEVISYDADTGLFFWLRKTCSKHNNFKTGDPISTKDNKGYLKVKIDGARYRLHTLAWLYVHGRHPEEFIDHINGCKSDNRILNLREVTGSQNQCNTTLKANNTSGFKGVSWKKDAGKWRARCAKNGKTFELGYFTTTEEARQAIEKFREEIHGEYHNHG